MCPYFFRFCRFFALVEADCIDMTEISFEIGVNFDISWESKIEMMAFIASTFFSGIYVTECISNSQYTQILRDIDRKSTEFDDIFGRTVHRISYFVCFKIEFQSVAPSV